MSVATYGMTEPVVLAASAAVEVAMTNRMLTNNVCAAAPKAKLMCRTWYFSRVGRVHM